MGDTSVLIVDDNPKNLQILGKTLKNENFHVEFALDGKTALKWINSRGFDLILLDIMMPEMDGFQVCSKIRSEKKYDNLPIIFLSAETNKESILKGFEIGAQDYVTKPFDSRELLARVSTHLEIKRNREQLQILNNHLEEKVKERTKQLRQANKELKEAHAKLLELDQAKTEFLRLISHEIRTPLNGILGPISLIKDRIETDNIESLLEILDHSVSRLERFSYNALLITQLKVGKDNVSKANLRLKKIIQDGLEELSGDLHKKQIQIDLGEISEHVEIEGDYGLLKTCLVNILNNAVRFSPQKGVINIKVIQKDKKTICEIFDQGPGFSEEILSRSFELFSPGEVYLDNKPGLGLYLSKLILEAHSGYIEVMNKDSGGAMIRLTF
jgi:two-component system sensor histidine kinase/response regulator